MDDPLEKTTELRMHFVSRYMTIEVGSTLFEDLNYLLMYLMLLLFGIAVVYGLFSGARRRWTHHLQHPVYLR